MTRTAFALLAVLALAGPALAACASPERVGEREARDQADDIADQLERDLGRGVRTYGVDARDVAGAEVVGRENVELLSASGEVNADEPALIDVRITGHVPAHDGGIGGRSWLETTVYRCYTFVLHSYYGTVREAGTSCDDDTDDTDDIDDGTGTDGEAEQPSSPPTSPPTIALGEAEAATLQDVLTRFDCGPDVTNALSSALPPQVNLDVEAVNGTIGVGVLAPPPTRDCLLGRRLPSGEVEVWNPPAILVAPGEASCDGLTAAAGGAQTSPRRPRRTDLVTRTSQPRRAGSCGRSCGGGPRPSRCRFGPRRCGVGGGGAGVAPPRGRSVTSAARKPPGHRR